MTSTVTTLARQIARSLNTERPGWRLYLNADGVEVARVYGPEGFGPNSREYTYFFQTYQEHGERAAGRVHHWTYAEVQDAIDAHEQEQRDAADPLVQAWNAQFDAQEQARWAAEDAERERDYAREEAEEMARLDETAKLEDTWGVQR